MRVQVPIDNFISQYVYGGQLKSDHSMSYSDFIDVKDGAEKSPGQSWTGVHIIVDSERQLTW